MNVEAYILIGGRSSRFGSDKALAEIGGKTLAERARDILRQSIPDHPISFVGDPEQFGAEAVRIDVPIISDRIAGRGPLGGLHTALENAKSEWIFLLACDLPMMTSEFLSRLSEECSDDLDAVVPEQPDGRMQPLCAFYRVPAALRIVNEIIATKPDAAMMAVIDGLKTKVVASDDEDIWTNLNTVEKLAEIARKLSDSEPI